MFVGFTTFCFSSCGVVCEYVVQSYCVSTYISSMKFKLMYLYLFIENEVNGFVAPLIVHVVVIYFALHLYDALLFAFVFWLVGDLVIWTLLQ